MIACTLTASAEGVKKEPVWAKVSAPPVVYSSENSDPTVIDYTYYKGDALDFTGYDGTHLQRAAVAVDPVALQGMKIKSIYAVGFPVSTDFGNPRFWISSELNNVHDILEKTSEMTDGRAVAELETSVDMPSTTFYVGYDLDVYADQGSFIPFSTGMPVAGAFYITYDDYGFSDYSSFFGPLTIGLILESEDGLYETSLLLSDYGATVTAHPGEPVTVTVNAINNGRTAVSSFAYEYMLDNHAYHMDMELPEPLPADITVKTPINLTLDPIREEGSYSIALSAVEVNGQQNPAAEKVANVDISVMLPPDVSVLDGTTPFAYTSEPPNDWYFAGGGLMTYDVGMKIDSPALQGMEVVGLRITGLTRTDGVGNFKGWLTSQLADTFDIETVVTGNPDENGELVVIFKTPYRLDENGVFVGYSCEALEMTQDSSAPIPLYYTGVEGKFDNGCWIRPSGYDWSDEGHWIGCATTITAYLRGELEPDNLSIGNMVSHSIVEKGKEFALTFEVNNNGGNDVKSFSYSYEVGGATRTGSKTLPEAIKPGVGMTSSVTLDFAGIADAGSFPMNVTVTEVNGKANTSAAPSTECTVNVIDHAVPHRVLMEEATGTWCGYCPRGWLAMRELSKLYPDFIGIAYHSNDPMEVGAIPFENAGFPYASLDRTLNADPYMGTSEDGGFGMADNWTAMRGQLTLGEIKIKADWNDDFTRLDVKSDVSFVLPVENAGYKIGYVLVGNGYCHPDNSAWTQKNYFSGTTQSGLLEELTKLPARITDMVFDDVAINSEAAYGVEGSLPQSIALNETYTHDFSFETVSIKGMLGDELIEDRQKLEVVAFIVAPDGKIINADKATPDNSSVDMIDSEATVVEQIYYSLDGRRIDRPSDGLFIVKTRMSDGTTRVRKIFIK